MLRQTRPVLFSNRDCATTCQYRWKDVTVKLEMNTRVTIKMRGRRLGFGQQIDGKVGSMKRRHAAATNRKRPSPRIWCACGAVKLLPSFYKLSRNATSDPPCNLLVEHCRWQRSARECHVKGGHLLIYFVVKREKLQI